MGNSCLALNEGLQLDELSVYGSLLDLNVLVIKTNGFVLGLKPIQRCQKGLLEPDQTEAAGKFQDRRGDCNEDSEQR